MAAATALKIIGASSILGVSSAVGYTWQVRQTNILRRRAELLEEGHRLRADLQTTRSELTREIELTETERTVAQERLVVLETMWADRMGRYDSFLEVCRSAIEVLPEGAHALSELADHYGHMSRYMPNFFEFDALASRVHAMSALANAASTAKGIDAAHNGISQWGIRGNKDVFRFLAVNDATMDIILRSVPTDGPTAADLPKNYEELSTTFARSRRYLTEAIEQYKVRSEEAAVRRQRQMDKARGEYVPFEPATITGLTRTALDWLRIEDDTAEPSSTVEQRERQAELARYRLPDRASVLEALVHCQKIQEIVDKEHDADWTKDPHVVRAVSALKVWSTSAEHFLIDEQVHRAVAAMAAMSNHALVAVDVEPENNTD